MTCGCNIADRFMADRQIHVDDTQMRNGEEAEGRTQQLKVDACVTGEGYSGERTSRQMNTSGEPSAGMGGCKTESN